MDGMILRITNADGTRIQVSDGMNTCYVNINRGKETGEALCRAINRSATVPDLYNSVFLFNDFEFDFEWDYENKRLMVSLETDSFYFLNPGGSLVKKAVGSKDLNSVLGNLQRESLKRQAMKKRLQASSFEGIDMGELIGITSTGGIAIDDELRINKELVLPNASGTTPLGVSDLSNLGGAGQPHRHETAPLDKCIMKDGWLKFPRYDLDSNNIPDCGGLYETFDEFIEKCK